MICKYCFCHVIIFLLQILWRKIMPFIEILRQIGLVSAISYLIGSIPTGYILVKLFTGQDIRTIGSGSTGATNVKRVMGKKWFFVVMVLDAIKGVLPVIAAIFVILGHSKSVFLNFSGGKSVASGVGTLIALDWQAGIIIAIVWGV